MAHNDLTWHGTKEPTEAQRAEIVRVKQYFPYRIAYGALNPATNEFVASAVPNFRIPNKLARDGWLVWTI